MHDKKSLPQIKEESPLRKNFDSFTAQHKLRNAQEEFAQAIYLFRAAEEANAPNLIALKREMEFLGRKLEAYRRWFYSGESIEEYVEWPAPLDRCPKPAWV